jgi:hypothetical protein
MDASMHARIFAARADESSAFPDFSRRTSIRLVVRGTSQRRRKLLGRSLQSRTASVSGRAVLGNRIRMDTTKAPWKNRGGRFSILESARARAPLTKAKRARDKKLTNT